MSRVALTGACLALLAAVSGCAGAETGAGTANETGAVSREDDMRSGSGPDVSRNPTADRRGPLPDGGAASCVEQYTPEAIDGRAFAFDGVVVAVGDSVSDRGDGADLDLPGVTFEVREWFSGGRGDTVTVDVQPATAVSSAPGTAYGVGSRLLVSGESRWGGSALEDPIAWGCGFSRYHDPETARAWRDATAR